MYSARKGFILTDALSAAAIVSVLACSVCWSVLSHEKTVRLIHEKSSRIEEDTEFYMRGVQACEVPCPNDPEADSS